MLQESHRCCKNPTAGSRDHNHRHSSKRINNEITCRLYSDTSTRSDLFCAISSVIHAILVFFSGPVRIVIASVPRMSSSNCCACGVADSICATDIGPEFHPTLHTRTFGDHSYIAAPPFPSPVKDEIIQHLSLRLCFRMISFATHHQYSLILCDKNDVEFGLAVVLRPTFSSSGSNRKIRNVLILQTI